MTPVLAMQPAPAADADLVAETLAGNPLAFQLLVERHQAGAFAIARNYTRYDSEVEDIVQDAFLKAFSRLEGFKQEASFATWLRRIVINTALDRAKRAGRSPVKAVEDPEVLDHDSNRIAAPDARLEREEIAAITREVLDELPEIFRTVLVLREFEGCAYQEMADHLQVPVGTVRSRLSRARRRVRELLEVVRPIQDGSDPDLDVAVEPTP